VLLGELETLCEFPPFRVNTPISRFPCVFCEICAHRCGREPLQRSAIRRTVSIRVSAPVYRELKRERRPTLSHSYATPGSYTVHVTAEDQDHGVSQQATTTVTVLSLPPSTIEGLVWVDFNNDGDFGETVIPGMTVTLTGADGLGNSVSRTTQ